MRAKLSAAVVKALECPANKERIVLWDRSLPGFGVIAHRNGRKVFVVQFREKGVERRKTIGAVETLVLPQARANARSILTKARKDTLRRAVKDKAEMAGRTLDCDAVISVRLPRKLVEALDKWRAKQFTTEGFGISRSEAVRRTIATQSGITRYLEKQGLTVAIGKMDGEDDDLRRIEPPAKDHRERQRRAKREAQRHARSMADKYVARSGEPK